MLHHDNAPSHNTLSIWEFLAKNNIAVVDQPPYSPDLASCDFFLFPKLKGTIKGIRFNDVEDIRKSRDEGAPRHPGEIFPGVYRGMTEEDGKVHYSQGRIL